MVRFWFKAAIAFLALSSAQPSFAQHNSNDFAKELDRGEIASKALLVGMVNGFLWANTELVHRGEAPLYCQPSKLTITIDQQVQIFQSYVRNNPDTRDYPPGLIMLQAMRLTFPC